MPLCGSAGEESACRAGGWVQSLGWEDPLEKGMATHSVFWPGESHGPYNLWGLQESDTTERLSLSPERSLWTATKVLHAATKTHCSQIH